MGHVKDYDFRDSKEAKTTEKTVKNVGKMMDV